MHEFQSATTLPYSVERVREFLGRPANLPHVSDPDLELEIIAAPEIVTAGETIEFRITSWGFKHRATHRYVTVSELEIAEEQIEGPMRSWRHRQLFQPASDLSCTLTDEVLFVPPGGMLGYLLTEDKIRESLDEGMRMRYELLLELLGRQ